MINFILLLLIAFSSLIAQKSVVNGETPADPMMPVDIVILNKQCATGVFLTTTWVVSGNWGSCADPGTEINYSDISLQLLDQKRNTVAVEEYTGVVSVSDPLFPDLKIVEADRAFLLTGKTLPLNIGLLCANCIIVYYPKTSEYTERVEEIVDPMPFMECSREFDVVHSYNHICSVNKGKSIPYFAPMYCNNSLTAIKLESIKSQSQVDVNIFSRTKAMESWLATKISNLEIEYTDYYSRKKRSSLLRKFKVTAIHHITCTADLKFAIFENVICIIPHNDAEGTPKGAALYCMNSLYALKYRSVYVTEEGNSTMELYFALGDYVHWFHRYIANISIADEIAVQGVYEETKSLGNSAWMEFRNGGVKISQMMSTIVTFIILIRRKL